MGLRAKILASDQANEAIQNLHHVKEGLAEINEVLVLGPKKSNNYWMLIPWIIVPVLVIAFSLSPYISKIKLPSASVVVAQSSEVPQPDSQPGGTSIESDQLLLPAEEVIPAPVEAKWWMAEVIQGQTPAWVPAESSVTSGLVGTPYQVMCQNGVFQFGMVASGYTLLVSDVTGVFDKPSYLAEEQVTVRCLEGQSFYLYSK